MNDDVSRRSFLSEMLTGVGSAVALGAIPPFAKAHAHAVRQLASPAKSFQFFTEAEATELAAVYEQIIPSDADSPGAREAGAIYFTDNLGMYKPPFGYYDAELLPGKKEE